MGGAPKALLEVGGRRIVDRVVDALAAVSDDLLLVTNTPDLYADLGLPMVGDVFPGGGALGGIYSGLRAARRPAIFTVACDMPFLSAALARAVCALAEEADVVIPEAGGQLETLHACYGRACLPAMERRLRAGQLKITGFFPEVRVRVLHEAEVVRLADPATAFMNVNTPAELERARALARTAAGAPPGGGA
jgi:molybdopterin-guanine dinucleotide biosynthesis protein A